MAGLTLINNVLPVMSGRDLAAQERSQAEAANNQDVVQGLAGYVRRCFDAAQQDKQQVLEERMLRNLRQRKGEYDPGVLAEIKKGGGSEIYMMLTSNKCRAAGAWLRDVLLGTRGDRPWTVDPTKNPDISPAMIPKLAEEATAEALQIEMILGQGSVQPQQMLAIAEKIKDRTLAGMRADARKKVDRMADKMEDQLQEGGFHKALNEFVDDLVTFPFAVMKGPVIRNKPQMTWVETADGQYDLDVQSKLALDWERVDPFLLYWAPHSTDVNDGYVIERHRLVRQALVDMKGVEGYSDAAIDAVLEQYGQGGLDQWLSIDTSKAIVEGKSTSSMSMDPERTIDALQFWGSVQGQMLIDWGMSEEEGIDPVGEYHCEVWVIGEWIIKAALNYDPLGRKPYYKASYEELPGSWAGNGVPDLVEDCQGMCNGAARALADNMGLSSGPQVWVNVDRLPNGEDVTSMYPWKIWQGKSDPYNTSSTQAPFGFFQPSSNAAELMGIYDKFSVMADEYSGIPRYMAGSAENAGGALRTSSGMSMLMSNAGKSIKNVMANIDTGVFTPMLERQYFYNMRYGDDPDLKGDVRIVANGANALAVKEQAQVRRNEFLGIVASNPLFIDIVGEESIAALLREVARPLDMDTDKIIPSEEAIRARALQRQMDAMQMAAMGAGEGQAAGAGKKVMPKNGQQMQTGDAVVDNFAPARQ